MKNTQNRNLEFRRGELMGKINAYKSIMMFLNKEGMNANSLLNFLDNTLKSLQDDLNTLMKECDT